MFKRTEPLKLHSVKPLQAGSDFFSKKISANYYFFYCKLNAQELLHLASFPPEIIALGGNQEQFLFQTNNFNTHVQIDFINQFLNRILLDGNALFSYQDRIFISIFLRRIGISNQETFIKQFRMIRKERENIEEIKKYFKQNNDSIKHKFFRRTMERETIEKIEAYYKPIWNSLLSISTFEGKMVEQRKCLDNLLLHQIKERMTEKTQHNSLQEFCVYFNQDIQNKTMSKTEWEETLGGTLLLYLADTAYFYGREKQNNSFLELNQIISHGAEYVLQHSQTINKAIHKKGQYLEYLSKTEAWIEQPALKEMLTEQENFLQLEEENREIQTKEYLDKINERNKIINDRLQSELQKEELSKIILADKKTIREKALKAIENPEEILQEALSQKTNKNMIIENQEVLKYLSLTDEQTKSFYYKLLNIKKADISLQETKNEQLETQTNYQYLKLKNSQTEIEEAEGMLIQTAEQLMQERIEEKDILHLQNEQTIQEDIAETLIKSIQQPINMTEMSIINEKVEVQKDYQNEKGNKEKEREELHHLQTSKTEIEENTESLIKLARQLQKAEGQSKKVEEQLQKAKEQPQKAKEQPLGKLEDQTDYQYQNIYNENEEDMQLYLQTKETELQETTKTQMQFTRQEQLKAQNEYQYEGTFEEKEEETNLYLQAKETQMEYTIQEQLEAQNKYQYEKMYKEKEETNLYLQTRETELEETTKTKIENTIQEQLEVQNEYQYERTYEEKEEEAHLYLQTRKTELEETTKTIIQNTIQEKLEAQNESQNERTYEEKEEEAHLYLQTRETELEETTKTIIQNTIQEQLEAQNETQNERTYEEKEKEEHLYLQTIETELEETTKTIIQNTILEQLETQNEYQNKRTYEEKEAYLYLQTRETELEETTKTIIQNTRQEQLEAQNEYQYERTYEEKEEEAHLYLQTRETELEETAKTLIQNTRQQQLEAQNEYQYERTYEEKEEEAYLYLQIRETELEETAKTLIQNTRQEQQEAQKDYLYQTNYENKQEEDFLRMHISQNELELIHKTFQYSNEEDEPKKQTEINMNKENQRIENKIQFNQMQKQEINPLTKEMIKEIVSGNIQTKIGELSDQVYKKIEKKLMNERKRRGF